MEQEEKLCDEAETVQEFTYLGDRVSAGGGFEAAVTARTTYGWVIQRIHLESDNVQIYILSVSWKLKDAAEYSEKCCHKSLNITHNKEITATSC